MMTMPFGRHKGRPVAKLPSDYLVWLAGREDLRDPLRTAVLGELWQRIGIQPPPPPREIPPDLAAVAEEIITAGLRALACVHHPDAGGSDETMAAVNLAAEALRDHVREVAGAA
jgi:hypothetical protein